jgi:hypothetical protein
MDRIGRETRKKASFCVQRGRALASASAVGIIVLVGEVIADEQLRPDE